MIHIDKNYSDIPRSLLSPSVQETIKRCVSEKKYIVNSGSLHYADVKENLRNLYFGKCAYCESKTDFDIDQYRPRKVYYWIAYEWSNFLPACPQCNRAKRDLFPVLDESLRITEPQFDKNEWNAKSQSFIHEQAQLLNPEIDNPEEHLSFLIDGRITGLTEKGQITIQVLQLNREYLLARRIQIINNLMTKINQTLDSSLEFIAKDNTVSPSFFKLVFNPIFNDLKEQSNPQTEYSAFNLFLYQNFENAIINQIEDASKREFLRIQWNSYWNETQQIQILPAQQTQQPPVDRITITSIQIKNIKCFDDVLIPFSNSNTQIENQSTILLGINGRGKTTILQLLALGVSGVERPLFESEWKNIIKNDLHPAMFSISYKIGNDDFISEYSISNDDTVTNKTLKDINKLNAQIDSFKRPFHGLGKLSRLPEMKEKANNVEKKVNGLRKIEDFFFVAYGTGRNAEKTNLPINENFKNIATLFGINNLIFQNGDVADYLKQGNAFNQIKRIITEIFNQAEEQYNRIELSRFDDVLKVFLFKTPTNPNIEIPLNALSAGFRTSFQWIIDLVVRAWKKNFDLDKPESIYGVVLIDELDTHLHIKWQRTIINTLQRVFKNIQFIVTTHSPFIVQSLSNHNIVSLQLENDAVIAKQHTINEGLSYENIIKELFDETATFSVAVEDSFVMFYSWLDAIRTKQKSIEDAEFLDFLSQLRAKGEEVATIISLELKQLRFELKND